MSEIAEKATDEILSFVERCDSGYVLVACKKCQFAVKALVERAIAESQARPFSDETIAEHVTTEILLKLPCHHLWKRVTHAFRQVIHSKIMEGLKLPRLGDGEPSPPPHDCPKCGKPKLGPMSTVASGYLRETEGMWCGCVEILRSGAAQEVSPHHYISTACLHGQHEKCRRFCKYCKVPCACKNCVHVEEVSPRRKAMKAAKEIEETCIEQDDSGHRFEVSRAAAIIEKLLADGDTRELKAAPKECVKQMKDAANLLEMFPDDYGDAINRVEKLLG